MYNKKHMLKFCPTCKKNLNIEYFGNNKSRKDGKQRECKSCTKIHQQKHYWNFKSPRLKETLKEGYKMCSCCNKELKLESFRKSKGRFGVGSLCKKCFNKKWNESQVKSGKNYQYIKKRKESDPLFKLKYLIRLRVNEVLKRNNITKKHSGVKYLGCSIEEYKQFLEKQFDENMNWDNHGIYWEIDHIIMLKSAKNIDELINLFHYSNTRPLILSDNRSKKYN